MYVHTRRAGAPYASSVSGIGCRYTEREHDWDAALIARWEEWVVNETMEWEVSWLWYLIVHTFRSDAYQMLRAYRFPIPSLLLHFLHPTPKYIHLHPKHPRPAPHPIKHTCIINRHILLRHHLDHLLTHHPARQRRHIVQLGSPRAHHLLRQLRKRVPQLALLLGIYGHGGVTQEIVGEGVGGGCHGLGI